MRLWIASLVGFACTPTLAPVAGDRAGATGAPEIVQAVASRYRTLASYSDHGQVAVSTTSGSETRSEVHRFVTSYVRGGRWRFAFEPTSGSPEAFELWSDGAHTYLTAGALDHVVDFEDQPALALDQLAESSHGVTRRALRNLDHAPDPPRGFAVVDATDRAWHLANGDEEWFVDRRTRLLTRVIEHHRFAPTASHPVAAELRVTIDYQPAANPRLAEAALAPPALTSPIESIRPPAWIGILHEGATTRIAQVVADGPAAKAGLQPGDEIISIDGHPVATSKQVIAASHAMKPNQHATLEVKRHGGTVSVEVIAEARPSPTQLESRLVGRPGPAISLPSLTGDALVTLAPAGVTVLDFWATWCGPCAVLSPHLDDLVRRFPTIHVVGISDEDRETVAAYLATHPRAYPTALDTDHRATSAYLVQGLPSVFVIDRRGLVLYAALGVPDFAALDAAIAAAVR